MAKRDYYMVLGVAPTAQPDEIKKAYRMLSKKYHPDLNPDMKTVSDEKMKELVEAYNVLNDSSKRKAYDKQPQFQAKRFAKSSVRAKADKSAFSKKPKYSKEPSLLERLLSPFLKKTPTSEGGSVLDPKQADVHFTLGLSMADSETFYDQAKAFVGGDQRSGAERHRLAFRDDHANDGRMGLARGARAPERAGGRRSGGGRNRNPNEHDQGQSSVHPLRTSFGTALRSARRRASFWTIRCSNSRRSLFNFST